MFRFLSKLPVNPPCWIYKRSLYRNVSHSINLDTVFPNIIRKSVIQAWRPPFSNYAGPHNIETVTVKEASYYDHIWQRLSGADTSAIITPTLKAALERYVSKIGARNGTKFTVNTAGKIRKFIGDFHRVYFRTGAAARDACKDGEKGGDSKPHPSKKQRKSPKKELAGPCPYIKEECLRKPPAGCKKKCGAKKSHCSKAIPCKKKSKKCPSHSSKVRSECGKKRADKSRCCSKPAGCGKSAKKKVVCGGGKSKKKAHCAAKKCGSASKGERPICPSKDDSCKKSCAKKTCGGKATKKSTCQKRSGSSEDKSSKCRKAVSCASALEKKKKSDDCAKPKCAPRARDRCTKQKRACGRSKSDDGDGCAKPPINAECSKSKKKKVVCSKKKRPASPCKSKKDRCGGGEKKICPPAGKTCGDDKKSGASGCSNKCDKGKNKQLKSESTSSGSCYFKEDPCKNKCKTKSKHDVRQRCGRSSTACQKKKEDPCQQASAKAKVCRQGRQDPCGGIKEVKSDDNPCRITTGGEDPCQEFKRLRQKQKEEDCCREEADKDPCGKSQKKCKTARDPCQETKRVKKDPCQEEDPCAKLEKEFEEAQDPCRKAKRVKKDPCQEEDPCAKLEKEFEEAQDPCRKAKRVKKDPCQEEDPCAKLEKELKEAGDPCQKTKRVKKDLCQEEDPCAKLERELEETQDPCQKAKRVEKDLCQEEDPCAKLEKELKEAEDPCQKSKQTCQKATQNKAYCVKGDTNACAKLRAITAKDPCQTMKRVKKDPCQEEDREDPCAKSQKECKTKADPCQKVAQTCQRGKEEDPCLNSNRCQKSEDDDPCREIEERLAKEKQNRCDSDCDKGGQHGNIADPCTGLPCKDKLKCEKQKYRWKRLMNEWLKRWTKC